MKPGNLTPEQKQIMAMSALRKIAMSYREMIDRYDTPPQEFAEQILAYIGDDLEMVSAENDELPAMFKAFHEWRKENWEMNAYSHPLKDCVSQEISQIKAVAETSEIRVSDVIQHAGQNAGASGLYVIMRYSEGEARYWNCSTEHGTGWHPRHPKQAFSKSELIEAIRLMVYEGWWVSGTAICELHIG